MVFEVLIKKRNPIYYFYKINNKTYKYTKSISSLNYDFLNVQIQIAQIRVNIVKLAIYLLMKLFI